MVDDPRLVADALLERGLLVRDMGFDVVHINTHETFGTPHGGGGPGAGPVAVTAEIAPILPGPRPARIGPGVFDWADPEMSIGRVSGWHGNVSVLIRAYAYLYLLGAVGLRASSALAVLNANYLNALLSEDPDVIADVAHPGPVMHELAKALIDHGVHPPTMYFPLVVDEALMVEPTETENPGPAPPALPSQRRPRRSPSPRTAPCHRASDAADGAPQPER